MRYAENCPRGPIGTIEFNTIPPLASVRTRFTLPDPVEGLAMAIAVVFSSMGPTVTRKDPLVTRTDGATAATSVCIPLL